MSVFPTVEGLLRYSAERGADIEEIVELEGDLTGDRDLDADVGALLVRPKRVVARFSPAR